jgi:16S rRNA processing protein RimM
MEAFFQIGIITSAHGVHGEVKVYPTTDDVKRFKRLKDVILWKGDASGENFPAENPESAGGKTFEIESVKFLKKLVVLKFRGIDSMEAAQNLRKHSLLVPRANAVRLRRDEYFIADLIGLMVQNEDGTEIGTLTDVLETGANDVYVIQLHSGKELLLPAIRQCVLDVDVESGFIRIHILEGLLDEAK